MEKSLCKKKRIHFYIVWNISGIIIIGRLLFPVKSVSKRLLEQLSFLLDLIELSHRQFVTTLKFHLVLRFVKRFRVKKNAALKCSIIPIHEIGESNILCLFVDYFCKVIYVQV